MYKLGQAKQTALWFQQYEKVLELLQPVRYKPTSVESMAQETKFR